MHTRREFLALSTGMLALLTGCIGSEPEPDRGEGPDVRTQPVQMRLTIPESYLAFTGNTADGAARDYADYSDGNIATSVLEDGSLELYVTDHWYGRLRTMWEDQLGKSLDSLAYVAPGYPFVPIAGFVLCVASCVGLAFDPSQRIALYCGIPFMILCYVAYPFIERRLERKKAARKAAAEASALAVAAAAEEAAALRQP